MEPYNRFLPKRREQSLAIDGIWLYKRMLV